MMEDFNSETDSDYTSYWRDWVSLNLFLSNTNTVGGVMRLGCSSEETGRGCPHDAIAPGESIQALLESLLELNFTLCTPASSYHAPTTPLLHP
jgi:hypothetical protein